MAGAAIAAGEWAGAPVRAALARLVRAARWLLKRRNDDRGTGAQGERARTGAARIRCPRCGWRPGREDRWECHCGCVWNTFETQARCPDCGFQHRATQCHACEAMSPHDAWYTPDA
jgi:hypothetical protein